MKLTDSQLKTILVGQNFIESDQFDSAQKEAKEKQLPIDEILVKKGLIKDEHLGKLVAGYIRFPFVNLRKEKIDETILKLIPELVAINQQIITFDRDENGLKLAMADPNNLDMIHMVGKRTGDEIIIYFATPLDIKRALGGYKKEMGKDFISTLKRQAKAAEGGRAEDETVINIVDSLLEYGYQNKASDIHIEPYENETIIRFRIDGVLHKVVNLPKSVHDIVVTRIKVLAKLRTDEHMAAQDGKFRHQMERDRIDIRVSVAPITDGEKIVMRLLSSQARQYGLEDLGLDKNNLKRVKKNIKKAWGMILVTGPTGSGKTTTLYSVLKILNTEKVNIATIEDPVEYDVEGVNQIQVNIKKKITFASGLRTIVRQDPDIIMVGEIRDEETAGIAVNSAMTGHLVLSTLHTNDAATSFPRLMDMSVEPFLVSSSVNVVLAQRLVRKIHEKCRESQYVKVDELKSKLSAEAIKKLSKGKSEIHAYIGKGCKACGDTGYVGRIGIFEVLEMSESVKELIMQKATADTIKAQAIKEGMTTMLEDGLDKVSLGVTTLDEVLRVIKEK